LSFELSSSLLSLAAGKLFEMTANDLLDAIVRRAHQQLK
jgi:ribosome-associated toxin RatA of RatAB toxin-antitoxin module